MNAPFLMDILLHSNYTLLGYVLRWLTFDNQIFLLQKKQKGGFITN